jgi:hypothetical protein
MAPNYDSEKNTFNKIRLSSQFSKTLVLDLESSTKLSVANLDKKFTSSIASVDKKLSDSVSATIQTVSTILDSSTILGSVTDLINSGKFSTLDNTKIYKTSNNIKLINCSNTWLYDNQIPTYNMLTNMTLYDHNNLTDNLVSTVNIYIDPFDISTPSNTLPKTKILYYKNFISNTSNKELNINFVNNATNSLYYLWTYEHQSSKYLKLGTNNLLIGPEIILDNYNFTEAPNNSPLVKISLGNSANTTYTTNTYTIKSTNNEFKIDKFNDQLFIKSKKDIVFNNYPNKKIKITITINDGKYTYDRVFFLTINKMLNNSTEMFVSLGYTFTPGKPQDIVAASKFEKLLTGKSLDESDRLEFMNAINLNDNCILIQQLDLMRSSISNDQSLTSFKTKLDDSITLFRNAKTADDYNTFLTKSLETVNYASTNVTFATTALTNGFTTLLTVMKQYYDATAILKTIPTDSIPYAISEFIRLCKGILTIAANYGLVAGPVTAELKNINTSLSSTNTNVLPTYTSYGDYMYNYPIATNFYTTYLTYRFMISSDLIYYNGTYANSANDSETIFEMYQLSGINRIKQINAIVKKTGSNEFKLRLEGINPITNIWLNIVGDTPITTEFLLPDVTGKYFIKFELGYNSSNQLFFKASISTNVLFNIYTTFNQYDTFGLAKRYF